MTKRAIDRFTDYPAAEGCAVIGVAMLPLSLVWFGLAMSWGWDVAVAAAPLALPLLLAVLIPVIQTWVSLARFFLAR
jgi:hypothetical protein